MGFLNHLNMYHFPLVGASSAIGFVRAYIPAVGILASNLGVPNLRASQDVQQQFLNDSIFRSSYGQGYSIATVGHILDTFGNAAMRTTLGATKFTMAIAFKITNLFTSDIMIGRRFSQGGIEDYSYRLGYGTNGDLRWRGHGASDGSDIAVIANAIEAGKEYIAYVSKDGAAVTNIGILEKGSTVWKTAASSESVLLQISADYDYALGGGVDNSAPPGVRTGVIDGLFGAHTYWTAIAIPPATLQLAVGGLADHFGAADPAGGGGGTGVLDGVI